MAAVSAPQWTPRRPVRGLPIRPGAIRFLSHHRDRGRICGPGADQLSAKTFDHGEYAHGDQDLVTNGDDAPPRLLAEGLQIQLNTPLTAIVRHDNSVIVRGGSRSFEEPAAIVAVPMGVLKS